MARKGRAGSSPAPGTGILERLDTKEPRMFRTRLAPTPSGYLHAGNAVNFLIAWKLARSHGGSVLLRIDDLDHERVRPEYIEDIFRSLEWLGIDWDEGPGGPEDFHSDWSQQQRLERYSALAGRLRDAGHLFACTCSRTAADRCECRNRGLSFDLSGVTWRLNTGAACTSTFNTWPTGKRTVDLSASMPEPVLRQRDGRAAYQLASLSDDVHWNIDLVVRGEDLLASTACQMHLARLLGLDTFTRARFVHHTLLPDASGGKLSKSAGASSLKAMREAGRDPHELQAQAERIVAQLLQA